MKIRKSDDEPAVEANLAQIEKVLNAPRISHGRVRFNYLLCFLSIDFDNDEAPPKDDEYTSGRETNLREIFRCARSEFLPRQKPGKPLQLVRQRPNWRRVAKAVQRELKRDLMTIVTASSTDENCSFDEGKYNSFASKLFTKLQAVNRRSRQIIMLPSKPLRAPIKTIKNRRRRYWEMARGFRGRDGGAILLGGQRYSLCWIPHGTLRDDIYFHLAGAIEEECLEDLKLCQRCKKLHLRDKYCSDACKVADKNKHRRDDKDEKTGRNYFQRKRAEKRKDAIAKAFQLVEEGAPLKRVVQRTRLSQRILKKAGVPIS